MRETVTRSPQEVDPLSWFTGPLLPAVFGAVLLVYGGMNILLAGWQSPLWWLQPVALACSVAGCLAVLLFTGPKNRGITPWRAMLPLGLAWAGVVLSGIGYRAEPPMLEFWWAGVGVGLVMGSLAPYSSPIRMIGFGLASSALTAIVVIAVFLPGPGFWPPLSRIVIGIAPVVIATVATAVFGFDVVHRILRRAANVASRGVSSELLGERTKLRLLHEELASLSARATPLLEAVVATGAVDAEQRAAAGALAAELRTELVERTNRSWLDTVALDTPMTVIDPERRADSMTPYQQSALRALLLAVLDGANTTEPSLVIELRGERDGSTAVVLSMDLELPEGRRVVLLAPYYLTLKTAVDELRWDSGDLLRMRFQIPGAQPD